MYEIDQADRLTSGKKSVPKFSFGTTSRFGTSKQYEESRKKHARPLTKEEKESDQMTTVYKSSMGKQAESKFNSSKGIGFGSRDRWRKPPINGLRATKDAKPIVSPGPGAFAEADISNRTLSYGKQNQSKYNSNASFSFRR